MKTFGFALVCLLTIGLLPAAAPAAPSGTGCAPAQARLRPGAEVPERNALTPVEAARAERLLRGALSGQRTRTSGTITVPVVFHVLHDGPRGNVPTARIRRQVEVLDSSYRGRHGGADTRIGFVLRKVTRTDNAEWYSAPDRHETTFMPKLRKGGPGTLNLYSADVGEQLLGWSSFPWKYDSDPGMDGVVIHPGSMPDGSIRHFNRGHTATHEVGHWLGLFHTFQDGCGGEGDRIADTPPEREPTTGCPADKNTCPGAETDPVHNYMNYSHDACMDRFTKGQARRMRNVWSAYRT